MTGATIIDRAKTRRVELVAHGDRIRIRGPEQEVTDDLLHTLRQHKGELLEALEAFTKLGRNALSSWSTITNSPATRQRQRRGPGSTGYPARRVLTGPAKLGAPPASIPAITVTNIACVFARSMSRRSDVWCDCSFVPIRTKVRTARWSR